MLITNFDIFINENNSMDNKSFIENLFKEQLRQERIKYQDSEKPEVTLGQLGHVMRSLKPGICEFSKHSEIYTYTEKLPTGALLVLYGDISNVYKKYEGYHFQIGVYKDNETTTQYGGGFGSQGLIGKSKTLLMGYNMYDTSFSDAESIIPIINKVKKYIQENNIS